MHLHYALLWQNKLKKKQTKHNQTKPNKIEMTHNPLEKDVDTTY